MGLAKAEAGMEQQPQQQSNSPCRKKNAADAGFLANARDHLDQFVNASVDEHRICLKKSIQGVGDFLKLRKQERKQQTKV